MKVYSSCSVSFSAGDVLEDEEDQPPAPQVYMASCFEDILINEWKSRMQYDQLSIPSQPDPSTTDEIVEPPAVTEISSGLTAISSNFKFVGNFDDPTEVIRRAPDFDSVILLLQDEFNHVNAGTPPYSISEIMRLHKEKHERRRQNKCETNAEIARDIEDKQRIELLKKIGPPWSWLAKFTEESCPTRSYNFIDIPSSSAESQDGDISGSDVDLKRTTSADSNQTVLEIKRSIGSSSRTTGITCSEDGSRENIRKSSSSVIGRVLSDVICRLEAKQSQGECNVTDIESLNNVIEQDFPNVPEAVELQKFLERADAEDIEFKDLNELNNYFISEIVKQQKFEKLGCYLDDENEMDPAQTLKECAEPDKVVEIFDESGIEVDNKLLQKKMSDKMILGLVDKEKGEDEPVTPESVQSIQSDATTTASEISNAKRTQTSTNQTHEQNTQTTPFLQQQKEKFRQQMERESQNRKVNECENIDKTVKSLVPALPGIGQRISEPTVEKFLLYMMRRAREQKGFIFPRNWQESECPPMLDEVSNEE